MLIEIGIYGNHVDERSTVEDGGLSKIRQTTYLQKGTNFMKGDTFRHETGPGSFFPLSIYISLIKNLYVLLNLNI